MPQDVHATCDGFGKKSLIDQALSCPKGGLVLARHNDATKEWVTLGARSLFPSAITYEPKFNSRIVQGERTRDGARQDSGTDIDGADIVVESPSCRAPSPVLSPCTVLLLNLGS